MPYGAYRQIRLFGKRVHDIKIYIPMDELSDKAAITDKLLRILIS